MATTSLTAYERETMLNMNDEQDFAVIYTAQRTQLTRLRKLPGVEEVRSGFEGSTEWAEFRVPAKEVRIGVARRRVLSESQREAAVQAAARARAAKSAKEGPSRSPRPATR